jgi:16S rRNA (cytosine1402-N4)-methyltransferase
MIINNTSVLLKRLNQGAHCIMQEDRFEHLTVLCDELPRMLDLQPGAVVVDATLGGGGHAVKVLELVHPGGRLVGIDRDQRALIAAEQRIRAGFPLAQLDLIHAPFSRIRSILQGLQLSGGVDALYADIGVSSHHLDIAQRGFSFMHDGPLDMRMDQSSGRTAEEILAESTENELVAIFRDFGEDPKARFIAQRIVAERARNPVRTTGQLARIVEAAVHYKERSRKHPATRVFQALRIAVNNELDELKSFIQGGFESLRLGGRLAIISFHSLEDRIVKQSFLDLAGKAARENLPRDLPITQSELTRLIAARGEVCGDFPTEPSEPEVESNPRARSAKLRVIRRIA